MQLHTALTLLELSNFLEVGRLFLPTFRFQLADSSSSAALVDFHENLVAMFTNLPAIDLSEEQSFFVVRFRPMDLGMGGSVLSPVVEIKFSDVDRVFSVTRQGHDTFVATNRLPGIVIHDPVFEAAWEKFFWDRHAYLTISNAFDLADVFVRDQRYGRSTPDYHRLASVVISIHSGRDPNGIDEFGKLLLSVLRFKRSTESEADTKHYNDASALSVVVDLFKCAFDKSDSTDLSEKCRSFCKMAKDNHRSLTLSELVTKTSLRPLVKALADRYGCPPWNIVGAMIYLLVRLHKQNGELRSIADLHSVLIPGFDESSVRFGIVLIGITEEPEVLINFVHRQRRQGSYGLFTSRPEPDAVMNPLLPDEHFSSATGWTDSEKMALRKAEGVDVPDQQSFASPSSNVPLQFELRSGESENGHPQLGDLIQRESPEGADSSASANLELEIRKESEEIMPSEVSPHNDGTGEAVGTQSSPPMPPETTQAAGVNQDDGAEKKVSGRSGQEVNEPVGRRQSGKKSGSNAELCANDK